MHLCCCAGATCCCLTCAVFGCTKAAFWFFNLNPFPYPAIRRQWTLNGMTVLAIEDVGTGEFTLVYPDLITKIEKQMILVLGKPHPSRNSSQLPTPEEEARIQKDFLDRFSVVIEKNQVILAKPNYKCSFNGRLVRFFQLQDEVVYQYNEQQGVVPIDKEIIPVAFQMDYIKASLVRISEQGVLSITPKPQVIHEWKRSKQQLIRHENGQPIFNCIREFQGWELDASQENWRPCSYDAARLLKEGDDFIWEIQRSENDLIHMPADELPNGSIENSDAYFGNFKLQAFLKNDQLSSVKLIPISDDSRLDATKKLTSDLWAVTLIDSGTSHLLNPLTWGGHAMIVIEGVRIPQGSTRARYFMESADAVGALEVVDTDGVRHLVPPQVRFFSDGERDPDKLRYQNKSRTFLINRPVIERMIQKIKEQQNSLFNFDFFFNNCAIWALKTLGDIGFKLSTPPLVYTPKNILDKLVTMEEFYSKRVAKLKTN